MRDEWQNYLLSKVELRSVQTPQKKKPKKTPKGYGILDGISPVTPAQNAEASSASKQEHEALLAAASVINRNQAKVAKDAAGDRSNYKKIHFIQINNVKNQLKTYQFEKIIVTEYL